MGRVLEASAGGRHQVGCCRISRNSRGAWSLRGAFPPKPSPWPMSSSEMTRSSSLWDRRVAQLTTDKSVFETRGLLSWAQVRPSAGSRLVPRLPFRRHICVPAQMSLAWRFTVSYGNSSSSHRASYSRHSFPFLSFEEPRALHNLCGSVSSDDISPFLSSPCLSPLMLTLLMSLFARGVPSGTRVCLSCTLSCNGSC